MIAIVNPYAGNNTAGRKWDTVYPALLKSGIAVSAYRLNKTSDVGRIIREALRCGETDFVAAGGDGTVNSILNAILEAAHGGQLGAIRLGAIGLGSSNDFHKPLSHRLFIEGIPCTLNFGLAAARDIGCVGLTSRNGSLTRYFLSNASIGVTAEANALFNAPGRMLACLRRMHTPSAILAAALQTIVRFSNIDACVQDGDGNARRTSLSNLAVIKNPHVSGNLRYNVPFAPDGGSLRIVLCENMSRTKLLRILAALGSGSLRQRLALQSWDSRSVTVKSQAPFAVEFDGEVVMAQEARFGLVPHCLRVCTC